jgi:hypothetical protein
MNVLMNSRGRENPRHQAQSYLCFFFLRANEIDKIRSIRMKVDTVDYSRSHVTRKQLIGILPPMLLTAHAQEKRRRSTLSLAPTVDIGKCLFVNKYFPSLALATEPTTISLSPIPGSVLKRRHPPSFSRVLRIFAFTSPSHLC